ASVHNPPIWTAREQRCHAVRVHLHAGTKGKARGLKTVVQTAGAGEKTDDFRHHAERKLCADSLNVGAKPQIKQSTLMLAKKNLVSVPRYENYRPRSTETSRVGVGNRRQDTTPEVL